ncbi:MAG: histidinol dehydrogenase [Rhodobacteraceae bacterium]|nr:histidinol dehydrogenase [Paracoccaceae bacterium]
MTRAVALHTLADLSARQRSELLLRPESHLVPYLAKVQTIIDAVREEGDVALARFAGEFDGAAVRADGIAATPDDFARAERAVDPELIETLNFCSENIRRFHERQMPESLWMIEMHPGVFAGERVTPIDSVACYIPRGKGSFPSVVMMTAIPALVAGVPRKVILTPPGPDGNIDAATLVAARLAGIEDVYRCGGAQGVAAVAYGTDTVPRCHKIVGPGSPWVVAAKHLLSDRLDAGTPAGPSESIVLCDETADGWVAALDLLNEAEHGPDSSAYLVTSSAGVAEVARDAVAKGLEHMGDQRAAFAAEVLGGRNGGIVLADSFDDAIAFVNDFAPEHLMVHADNPFEHLDRIRNAGEILLGEHTPICIGNFALGPNAVLPTNAAAMTHSPLGVHDFLKRISVGHMTRSGYDHLAPHAHRLARYEGFDAHANAVSHLRDAARTASKNPRRTP